MINVSIKNQDTRLKPKITVIGVGGAGGNAVNNMIASQLEGCEFLVCNTDAQALENSVSQQKIQLGAGITRGLGAGANPEVGQASAEESIHDIMGHLEGSNMVFVTAGMGGGTGTGAAPIIAQAAREQGILTVGVVTKPFHFEGTHRMKLAEQGIEEMQKYVDTLIIIPNQNLFRIANEKTTFADAFCLADEVLQSGVRGVTDLMVMPGIINLDFADVRSVMAEMGKAMMGTGEAEGERRATEAAEAAISNPLLDDVSMQGARGILINITGGNDMTLFEVDEAANRIREEVDANANIIFGSTFDENLDGKMRVSVVATGIDINDMTQQSRPMPLTQPASQATQRTVAQNTVKTANSGFSEKTAPTTGVERNLGSLGNTGTGGFTSGFGSGNSIPSSIIPTTAQPSHAPTASAQTTPTTAGVSASTGVTEPVQPQTTGHYSATDYTSAAVARKTEETTDVSATHMKPMHNPLPTKRSIPSVPAQPQAQRHGNAFIPPKPVDPKTTTPGVEKENDLFVSAPTPSTTEAATPETKSPSFFERITGQKKQAAAPQVTAPKGNLSVEAGGKKDTDEDELDIPAFLRRQAN